MPDRSAFAALPIEVTVALGTARPTLEELLALSDGSILALDKGVEDPVDLFVGDRLIGRGTLEEDESGSGLHVRVIHVAEG